MTLKNLMLGAALAVGTLCASAAGAVTVETTNFITSPTNFNGFESLGAFAGSPDYNGTVAYTEGGVTVQYVGSPGGIWTTYMHEGDYGWYPDGGSTGYTRVTLAGMGQIDAIQFLAGSGFGEAGYELQYELLNHGMQVATGTAGVVGNPFRTYGFSGGGFDEVRLQNQSGTGRAFSAGSYEAGSFDSFAVRGASISAAPEPASWALMIAGFGLAGASLRRRRNVFA